MDPDKLLDIAVVRHRATRAVRLASWVDQGGGAWAVVTTIATNSTGEAVVAVEGVQSGQTHPIIAAAIAKAQSRVDDGLQTSSGGAWEDFWHEGALLSLICDAGGELMLRCRATPALAQRIVGELEHSCLRVRARISAVSTEFPRLVAVVQALCRRPMALAA